MWPGGGPPLRVPRAAAHPARDGDPELRRLVSLVLTADGHEVVEASDGSALLEAIAPLVIDGRRSFDVIISAQAIAGPAGRVGAGRASLARPAHAVRADDREPRGAGQARRLGAVVLDRPFDQDTIRRAVASADALVGDGG